MTKEEFIKGLKYLGIAYNHSFSQDESIVWYDFFKNYSILVFNNAIKDSIENNKFLPRISDLTQLCDENKVKVRFVILEEMKLDGYFKDVGEYEKAYTWLENNTIPNWFKDEMKKYKQNILSNNNSQLSLN